MVYGVTRTLYMHLNMMNETHLYIEKKYFGFLIMGPSVNNVVVTNPPS